jgi:antitoxin component of MazEF toxin-antitoxin module
MIKTITKIGNSHGIIFDSALLQLAHLKPGDEVNVEVHAGGMITIAPLSPSFISVENATESAKRIISKNDELFKRLS